VGQSHHRTSDGGAAAILQETALLSGRMVTQTHPQPLYFYRRTETKHPLARTCVLTLRWLSKRTHGNLDQTTVRAVSSDDSYIFQVQSWRNSCKAFDTTGVH